MSKWVLISCRPYKLPTYSRAYIQFKNDQIAQKFISDLKEVSFADETGDEMIPECGYSFFNRMKNSHKRDPMEPLNGTISNDSAFQLFLRVLNNTDVAAPESYLVRPEKKKKERKKEEKKNIDPKKQIVEKSIKKPKKKKEAEKNNDKDDNEKPKLRPKPKKEKKPESDDSEKTRPKLKPKKIKPKSKIPDSLPAIPKPKVPDSLPAIPRTMLNSGVKTRTPPPLFIDPRAPTSNGSSFPSKPKLAKKEPEDKQRPKMVLMKRPEIP